MNEYEQERRDRDEKIRAASRASGKEFCRRLFLFLWIVVVIILVLVLFFNRNVIASMMKSQVLYDQESGWDCGDSKIDQAEL